MSKGSQDLIVMFQLLSEAMSRETLYLTELDGAIGDSDHGITMKLGFEAVNLSITQLLTEGSTSSEIFSTAAAAFHDAVGASTGPLYATAFREVANSLEGIDHLDARAQAGILDAIVAGIQKRGHALRGEKTMLDAWIPASEAAYRALKSNQSPTRMWDAIVKAAADGVHETSTMTATKGRASRLGERSLGHIDPGAASALIILHAMSDCFGQE